MTTRAARAASKAVKWRTGSLARRRPSATLKIEAGRLLEVAGEVETDREAEAAEVEAEAETALEVDVSVGETHLALPRETLVPSSHASAAAAPPRAVGTVPGTWRKAASAAGRLVTTRVGTASNEEEEKICEDEDEAAAAEAFANASMAAASRTPFATRSRTRFFKAALVASRAKRDSWARPSAENEAIFFFGVEVEG